MISWLLTGGGSFSPGGGPLLVATDEAVTSSLEKHLHHPLVGNVEIMCGYHGVFEPADGLINGVLDVS
jgi:hypothetical protein